MSKKYYIETLGCPKNFNDSEYAAGVLDENGYEYTHFPEEADFIIVNTCGFIGDAKKESIDRIFEMNSVLKEGGKLLVSGCLSQRYPHELFEEIPEVSAFIGVNEYSRLAEILDSVSNNESAEKNENEKVFVSTCDLDHLEKTVRRFKETPYTATIKIAEGCNNRCAYCIIPAIRGKYRSKRIEDIVEEAKELSKAGCKELILIAQDLTYYGKDLYGEYSLARLLKELVKVEGIAWIRLMYCYDERITDELIQVMAEEEKICNYLDIPIQHASDKVLKEMYRGSTRKDILNVISKLRNAIPDIAIRTSLIVGFPGETEEDFDILADFVEETKFARLGVFKYSLEENTPAGERDDQIPEEVKEERYHAIMRRQMEISLENNKLLVDKVLDVMVEEIDSEESNGLKSYIGRTRYDAPEIDNSVIFTSSKELNPGDIVKVRITDAFDYDLVGIEL